MSKKGRVTIPTDDTFVEGTKEIAKLWGADAVRDCDGTVLPKNAKELAGKVYKTYFIVRGDNEWGRAHKDQAQRIFLMSDRIIAKGDSLTIDPMNGYLKDEFEPDEGQIKRWQVFDRTLGKEIKTWSVKDGKVEIKNAVPYHEYTLNFLAKVTWHPVQIYNYITNSWTCEKQLSYDPAYPETREYVKRFAKQWCEENPDIDVCRFTTFLYQFSLVFNNLGKEKYVDWFGYTEAASPMLLDAFEKEYGYEISAEDIIQNGTFSNPFVNPNKKVRDYMDFVSRFVTKVVREIVDVIHSYGKEAMMFLGDDWIGSEPYGKYFKDMNLDAVVGSIGGGVTVRMLAEIPHVKYHEGRFLPYFFPDTFFEGNDANILSEFNKNWMTARRAMLRKPLDRMGFGGYLSLAAKFPTFINRVTEATDEFRTIFEACNGGKPYAGATVAILNAWGSLRSWMSHMVAHELWYQQIYSYQGVLEALSGLAVNVKFISFDEVIENGVPEDVDAIINVGQAGTSYSGGEYWNDERLVSILRKWVDEGHGFIGIGEPSAFHKGGTFFQMRDVLGVDKELGFTMSEDKYNISKESHFIVEDVKDPLDYGESMKNVYALPGAKVVDIEFSDRFKRNVNVGEVHMAVNDYGKGHGIYLAGLPYSTQNARILYRSIYFSANKEKEMFKAFSSNPLTECTYYEDKGLYAIVNNSLKPQKTVFYDIHGKAQELEIEPNIIKWIKAK